MSRPAATAALVAVIVLGVLGVLAIGSTDKRNLAFATDVAPTQLGAVVTPHGTACERRVHVDGSFDVLRLALTTAPPGPDTTVTVTRTGSRDVLATGPLPAGFARSRRIGFPAVQLSRAVEPGGYADVCIHSRGDKLLFLLGHSSTQQHAVIIDAHGRERRLRTGIHFDFLTTHPRSALSQVPAIFHRAALFRVGPIGTWTYWVLLAVALLGVPALLIRSLWMAELDAPEDERTGR